MKIKSALLLGLSTVALASCGSNLKSYESNVLGKVFKSALSKAIDESVLLNSEAPYSFVMESESKSTLKTTYIKSGDSVSDELEEISSKAKLEFDAENYIIRSSGKSEVYEEKPSEVQYDKYDGEVTYQIDKKNLYTIDMESKLYTKNENAKPKEALYSLVNSKFSTIKYIINLWYDGDSKTSKYFIDGNTYTYEFTLDEENDETGVKSTGKTTYQITLDSKKIELCSESKIEKKGLNFKEEIEDNSLVVITKQDVSLKEVGLDKYLDVTDDDDIDTVNLSPTWFMFALLGK